MYIMTKSLLKIFLLRLNRVLSFVFRKMISKRICPKDIPMFVAMHLGHYLQFITKLEMSKQNKFYCQFI